MFTPKHWEKQEGKHPGEQISTRLILRLGVNKGCCHTQQFFCILASTHVLMRHVCLATTPFIGSPGVRKAYSSANPIPGLNRRHSKRFLTSGPDVKRFKVVKLFPIFRRRSNPRVCSFGGPISTAESFKFFFLTVS